MFQGFSQQTFEFFMAIRFNNNREFFLSNHDWYEQAVRQPLRALVESLQPCIFEIDPNLETRPQKVISRINRDTRFSHDKSPYRDYMWFSFRRPAEDETTQLGFYFDISDEGASFGMGFYNDNRPVMAALRRRLQLAPEELLTLAAPVLSSFQLLGSDYKRLALPETLPPEAICWYRKKSFYLEQEIHNFDLMRSAQLSNFLIAGFRQLAPLYHYLQSLAPEAG